MAPRLSEKTPRSTTRYALVATRALPGARHLDPGWQGFLVHAHRLGRKEVVAPLSLIVSAFGAVEDARGTLTPQLRSDPATPSWCSSTSAAQEPASAARSGAGPRRARDACPDLDDPALLKNFFAALQKLRRSSSVPRPVRRRAVHHRLRDVVRRHCA